MASRLDFVEYVCEQLSGAGEITYKKMFGEYSIYCRGKIIGTVCDDQFFLKPTEAGRDIYPDCNYVPPYDGAKPCMLIERLDDKELMTALISAAYRELPEPKPKKKKPQGPKIS